MNGIMNDKVNGISRYESTVQKPAGTAKQEIKKKKEKCCEKNGNQRGHDQPVFIFRKMMMYSMNGVLNFFF